ncbi:hypothetical protein V5799_013791 [Amblyomma americanum]|uniref:Uncharacterized protein n=1 Tax=Amblyomma americanum TaxID=6943 RepID=A0AAQ4E4V9_AMBAM
MSVSVGEQSATTTVQHRRDLFLLKSISTTIGTVLSRLFGRGHEEPPPGTVETDAARQPRSPLEVSVEIQVCPEARPVGSTASAQFAASPAAFQDGSAYQPRPGDPEGRATETLSLTQVVTVKTSRKFSKKQERDVIMSQKESRRRRREQEVPAKRPTEASPMDKTLKEASSESTRRSGESREAVAAVKSDMEATKAAPVNRTESLERSVGSFEEKEASSTLREKKTDAARQASSLDRKHKSESPAKTSRKPKAQMKRRAASPDGIESLPVEVPAEVEVNAEGKAVLSKAETMKSADMHEAMHFEDAPLEGSQSQKQKPLKSSMKKASSSEHLAEMLDVYTKRTEMLKSETKKKSDRDQKKSAETEVASPGSLEVVDEGLADATAAESPKAGIKSAKDKGKASREAMEEGFTGATTAAKVVSPKAGKKKFSRDKRKASKTVTSPGHAEAIDEVVTGAPTAAEADSPKARKKKPAKDKRKASKREVASLGSPEEKQDVLAGPIEVEADEKGAGKRKGPVSPGERTENIAERPSTELKKEVLEEGDRAGVYEMSTVQRRKWEPPEEDNEKLRPESSKEVPEVRDGKKGIRKESNSPLAGRSGNFTERPRTELTTETCAKRKKAKGDAGERKDSFRKVKTDSYKQEVTDEMKIQPTETQKSKKKKAESRSPDEKAEVITSVELLTKGVGEMKTSKKARALKNVADEKPAASHPEGKLEAITEGTVKQVAADKDKTRRKTSDKSARKKKRSVQSPMKLEEDNTDENKGLRKPAEDELGGEKQVRAKLSDEDRLKLATLQGHVQTEATTGICKVEGPQEAEQKETPAEGQKDEENTESVLRKSLAKAEKAAEALAKGAEGASCDEDDEVVRVFRRRMDSIAVHRMVGSRKEKRPVTESEPERGGLLPFALGKKKGAGEGAKEDKSAEEPELAKHAVKKGGKPVAAMAAREELITRKADDGTKDAGAQRLGKRGALKTKHAGKPRKVEKRRAGDGTRHERTPPSDENLPDEDRPKPAAAQGDKATEETIGFRKMKGPEGETKDEEASAEAPKDGTADSVLRKSIAKAEKAAEILEGGEDAGSGEDDEVVRVLRRRRDSLAVHRMIGIKKQKPPVSENEPEEGGLFPFALGRKQADGKDSVKDGKYEKEPKAQKSAMKKGEKRAAATAARAELTPEKADQGTHPVNTTKSSALGAASPNVERGPATTTDSRLPSKPAGKLQKGRHGPHKTGSADTHSPASPAAKTGPAMLSQSPLAAITNMRAGSPHSGTGPLQPCADRRRPMVACASSPRRKPVVACPSSAGRRADGTVSTLGR